MLSNLKRLRLERGLKQQTVAKAIEVSSGFLCGLENGSRVMPERVREKLAEYYGVAVKELM